MKTFTIRLPDVEAEMLVEVQKSNKEFKDLRCFVIISIHHKTDRESKIS